MTFVPKFLIKFEFPHSAVISLPLETHSECATAHHSPPAPWAPNFVSGPDGSQLYTNTYNPPSTNTEIQGKALIFTLTEDGWTLISNKTLHFVWHQHMYSSIHTHIFQLQNLQKPLGFTASKLLSAWLLNNRGCLLIKYKTLAYSEAVHTIFIIMLLFYLLFFISQLVSLVFVQGYTQAASSVLRDICI